MSRDQAVQRALQPRFFYILLVILGAVVLYVIRDYLGLLLLAFVTTTVAEPLYDWILKRVKREYLASTLTTLLLLIFVIVPVVVALSLLASEIAGRAQSLESHVAAGQVSMDRLVLPLADLTSAVSAELARTIRESGTSMSGWLVGAISFVAGFLVDTVVPLILNGVGAVMSILLFLVALIFLFPVREQALNFMSDISPIGKSTHDRLLQQFEATTKGTVYSVITMMLLQGSLGGLMLLILGVPGALMWAVVLAVVVIVPFAAGLITFGISTWLVLQGAVAKGVVLYLWAIFVIGTADSVVRARILKRGEAGIPELLSIFSALGGLRVFGLVGGLYGPLLAALLYAALRIEREDRSKATQVDSSAKPAEDPG